MTFKGNFIATKFKTCSWNEAVTWSGCPPVNNKDLELLAAVLTFEDAEDKMPKVKSRVHSMARGNDPLLARASRRVLQGINAEEKKYAAVPSP